MRGGWGGPPPARYQAPPPPCFHFLRGACAFGDACRYSHEPPEEMPDVLPFRQRQLVQAHSTDNRSHSATLASSSPGAWRLRLMSYNILADHLAHEHAAELYNSTPRHALQWAFRGRLVVREIAQYLPDVVCLQEVDHFSQLEAALRPLGYRGVYTKRTGGRRDGLATFWRADVVCPVKQKNIKFNSLGLKDNVAQLTVFRRVAGSSAASADDDARPASSSSSADSDGSLSGRKRGRGGSGGHRGQRQKPQQVQQHIWFGDGEEEEEEPAVARAIGGGSEEGEESVPVEDAIPMDMQQQQQRVRQHQRSRQRQQPAEVGGAAAGGQRQQQVVVGNIHVLFNPRRGDIKLGQVRTLLEQAHRLAQRHAAPAMICGDFNSAAGSAVYQFISEGQLDLCTHDRKHMSGQVESAGRNWHALRQDFLWRQEQRSVAVAGAAAGLASNGAYSAAALEALMVQQLTVVPPYAPPPPLAAPAGVSAGHRGLPRSRSSSASMRWTAEHLLLAAGAGIGGPSPGSSSAASSSAGSACIASHPLQVASAYAAATGSEPPYTTCHDKFIGTVDYIWFTPSSPSRTSGSSDASHDGNGDTGGAAGAGSAWAVRPLAVLQPPALQSLRCGLPNHQWPSDHVCLLADFELWPTLGSSSS